MSRNGVVLIAAGSPVYGGWALNLAMGLKQANNAIHITLFYKENALNHIQKYIHVFNEVKEIPDECVNRNGFKSLIRPKVCLYDLSPYEETIFIDADVMWFGHKNPQDLFNEFSGIDFTIGCRSKNDLDTDPRLIWVLPNELKEKHNATDIYNLSSEFIYFKKTEKVKEFFDLAKKYFDEPGVEYNRFNGSVPDELAFQIAMFYSDIKPHKERFLPFYWEHFHKKNAHLSELYKQDWYGYSIGGNHVTTEQKLAYDSLANIYAKGFGLKYPILSANKRELFELRKHI